MGRNRTPTAILDTKGGFLKHKNRQQERVDEPTTDRPLGGPPKHLSSEEKKIWKSLEKQMLPGVVFESDRTQFELLVRLKTKMTFNYETMSSADKALLVSLGSKFAMNPADRSKVATTAPKKSSLQQFLNRKPTKPSTDAVQ